MADAVGVRWTHAEVAAALDGVSASKTERGRKQALKELKRAETRLAKDSADATRNVMLRFSEKPLGLIATVLTASDSRASQSALRKLQNAGLRTATAARATPAAATDAQVPGAPVAAPGGVGIIKASGPRKVGDSRSVNRGRRPWKG
jgi:hypothetical protein